MEGEKVGPEGEAVGYGPGVEVVEGLSVLTLLLWFPQGMLLEVMGKQLTG